MHIADVADVAGALVSRILRASTADLLADVLAPLVSSYDVVVIDTPPVDSTLQVMGLGRCPLAAGFRRS